MTDELSRVTERVRQNRTARQATADDSRGQQTTPASRADGLFLAGDRVFDLLSGIEGEVVRLTDHSGALSSSVTIRLDNGDSATRLPFQLLWRPKPPTGET